MIIIFKDCDPCIFKENLKYMVYESTFLKVFLNKITKPFQPVKIHVVLLRSIECYLGCKR